MQHYSSTTGITTCERADIARPALAPTLKKQVVVVVVVEVVAPYPAPNLVAGGDLQKDLEVAR